MAMMPGYMQIIGVLLYGGFYAAIIIGLIKLIKWGIRLSKRTDHNLSEISETLTEIKEEIKALKQGK